MGSWDSHFTDEETEPPKASCTQLDRASQCHSWNSHRSVWYFFPFLLPQCHCPVGLWSFDITITQLLQNIPEAEQRAVNSIQCSLNDLRDLIHSILVMLALGPQQFGMLACNHRPRAIYFYARKCTMTNARSQKRAKKGTSTWEVSRAPLILAPNPTVSSDFP